jgi:GAF domain-containing protein
VALDHGILSVLSTPMNTETLTVGAINLYAERREAFGATDAELATEFAVQAAYLLVNAQAYWDARTLSDNLTQAMASRAEIEQAKGVIMAATGMNADEAFDELRRQSQYENVKLRDIAREIVQRTNRRRDGS